MEFAKANLQRLFCRDVCCVTAASLSSLNEEQIQTISSVIDSIGRASAKARNITTPITTVTRIMNPECKLFVANMPPSKILGFVLVCRKLVTLKDAVGTVKEVEAICLMDAFVCPQYHRSGIGSLLFERLMEEEAINISNMVFESPTSELMGFLSKNFSLVKKIEQTSHHVIFEQFFLDEWSHSRPVGSTLSTRPSQQEIRVIRTGSNIVGGRRDEGVAVIDDNQKRTSGESKQSLTLELIGLSVGQQPHLSRTPSAGRRKGIPQSSTENNAGQGQGQVTRRPPSRRSDNRSGFLADADIRTNEAPKNIPFGSSNTMPLNRRSSQNAFPAAPVTLRSFLEPAQTCVFVSNAVEIPNALPKTGDIIPPWEVENTANTSDRYLDEVSSRPSSVNSPTAVKIQDLSNFSLNSRLSEKDEEVHRPRNGRRELRLGGMNALPALRQTPGGATEETGNVAGLLTLGARLRSPSNVKPRRTRSLVS